MFQTILANNPKSIKLKRRQKHLLDSSVFSLYSIFFLSSATSTKIIKRQHNIKDFWFTFLSTEIRKEFRQKNHLFLKKTPTHIFFLINIFILLVFFTGVVSVEFCLYSYKIQSNINPNLKLQARMLTKNIHILLPF